MFRLLKVIFRLNVKECIQNSAIKWTRLLIQFVLYSVQDCVFYYIIFSYPGFKR